MLRASMFAAFAGVALWVGCSKSGDDPSFASPADGGQGGGLAGAGGEAGSAGGEAGGAGAGGAAGGAGAGGGSGVGGGGAGGSGGGGNIVTCADAAAFPSYVGCEFWPTVVANNVWATFDYAVVVANAGQAPAHVLVTRGATTLASAAVPPGQLTKIYLPWVTDLKGPEIDNCGSAAPITATVRANGGAYHLVSDSPVSVYQFNPLEYKGEGGPTGKDWSSCPGSQTCASSGSAIGCFAFSADASLLLPTSALTGHYRVFGNHGWDVPGSLQMTTYVAVTGTADNTTVKVKLSATGHILGGGGIADTTSGGTTQFLLDAGDVVELVGEGLTASDLSGSLVQADKPVQLLAGSPCMQEPIGTAACDHIEETVLPSETLGQHYVVTRPTGPAGTPVSHVVRLYGNVDGTALSYPAGTPSGYPTVIAAGQIIEGPADIDFEIVASHEIGVGTVQLGAQLVDPQGTTQQGDPSLSAAAPVEQWRRKYVFLAPTDYAASFADIVLPVGAAVQVDGAPIAGAPSPVGTGAFRVARVPLAVGQAGAHVVTSDKPVGIQVVGYGSYTSYQYPAGLDLARIAPPAPGF